MLEFILGVFTAFVIVFFLKIFKDGNSYDLALAEQLLKQKQEYIEYLEKRNADLEANLKKISAEVKVSARA